MDEREAMRAAEMAEAACLEAMYAGATQSVSDELGMSHRRIGGGAVCLMARDPLHGFWNRAIGLGVDEPLTEDVVDEVLEFAREGGAPLLVVPVAPGADPGTWEHVLASRGLSPSAAWVKFVAPGGFSAEEKTEFDVEQIGPEIGVHFARVMCEGFKMPLDSPLPDWFATIPGAPGMTAYAAFDRHHKIVATAAMHVSGELASLCGAATLPEARHRGAQSALMARRLHDANALGVRWIATETGTETDEDPNPSLHNMRRLGLTELYERRNWIWRPEPRRQPRRQPRR